MTGGGLYILVAYGAQNVLLSGNPDFTFWYMVVKKHSHFSQESVTIEMDGPNELFYDEPIQVRAKIQRIGDLLSDLYFTFTIPDIYSKFVAVPSARGSQYEFQWVRYLGAQIIQDARFLVGGSLIQTFDSDYLISTALADQATNTFPKWRQLVGDVTELTDPANGQYAGGAPITRTTGFYPTVTPATNVTAQTNAPSIPGRDIVVPLGFWFSQHPSLALPLVALQYHEVEVQLTLRPIEQLYTVLDPSGSRVRPGYRLTASTAEQRTGNVQYTPLNEPAMQIKNFLTDIGYTVPTLNTWPLNPRLQATYVYLTDEERKTFVTRPLNYMVKQITKFPNLNISARQYYNLYTQNTIPRVIVVPRRTDSALYRNQWTNYTNWYRYPIAPFTPTNNPIGGVGSSGVLVPGTQLGLIQQMRILADGNEIQEIKPISFYREQTSWTSSDGQLPPDGLAIYAFSLETSKWWKPSGSLNSSRVKNLQLDIQPYPLIQSPNYLFDYFIYVESINWFTVEAGMGGLKFMT